MIIYNGHQDYPESEQWDEDELQDEIDREGEADEERYEILREFAEYD